MENGILIKDYKGDNKDASLLELLDVLGQLGDTEDVRIRLAQLFSQSNSLMA